ARLTLDRSGRPWLLYRHRQENNWRDSPVPVVGAIWLEYATARVGASWSPPQPLPRSDNLLDNRPALVAPRSGPVLAFYSGDGRLHREGWGTGPRGGPEPKGKAAQKEAAAAANAGRVNNDLFVAALSAPANAADPDPGTPAVATEPAPPAHPDE